MIINGDNITSNVNNKIDISNPFTLSDGTAALPSLTFTNSSTTGLFRSGSNVIGISVSGTKVADIDINGITAQTPYWNIVDQKPSGTAGGAISSGIWQTRVLNTTIGVNTIVGSSLSSNRFTLPTGTYRIYVRCPGYQINSHKARLRNITDSSDTLIGSSCFAYQIYGGYSDSIINGVFIITSSKTFEIQQYCTLTDNNNGLGQATGFGVPEIYASVELWKLGN